jgi:predicted Zn-dependent protease
MKKAAFIISVLLVILAIFLSCNRQMIPFEVQKGKVKVYDSATFERYFVEAIKLKLFGNSSDALSLLEQCLIINPGSDAVCFQMAQILIALGDENNAKKYALKAYELDPKNFWYFMMLAGTYYKEHNIDSAIIFYDKASKAFPEKENLLLTLGNLYSENKNYEKADAILEALDKKYGINEGSTVSTVKNLMRGEKYNEALEKARILVEKYPDEILYKGLLAEIYRGLGDAEKAMKIYQDLLDKDPDNPETLLSLCDFLINEKKYDDLMLLVNKVAINDNVSRGDKISLFTRLIETEELTEKYGNKLDISLRVLEAAYINDDIIQLLRPEL